jgi:hypothetical protein
VAEFRHPTGSLRERVPRWMRTSMTNSTYDRRRKIVSMWRKSRPAAQRPGYAGLSATRCRHRGVLARLGCPAGDGGRWPHWPHDRAGPVHHALGDTPPRVLPAQSQRQHSDLLIDRPTAESVLGTAAGGPPAADAKPAMWRTGCRIRADVRFDLIQRCLWFRLLAPTDIVTVKWFHA